MLFILRCLDNWFDLFPLISSVNQFKTDKVICLTQKWTLTNSEKIGHICTEYCQIAEKYRDICSSAISYKSTLLVFFLQYFSYDYYYFTVFCLNKYSLGELKRLLLTPKLLSISVHKHLHCSILRLCNPKEKYYACFLAPHQFRALSTRSAQGVHIILLNAVSGTLK